MGNYRFRLSDMMPNAWFYKLREIGSRNHPNPNHKTKPQHQTPVTTAKTKQPHHSYPRKSYHFTRDLNLNPPETLKSSKQRTFRKKQSSPQSQQRTVSVMSSSVSAGCGCRARPHSPPEYSASSSSFSNSSDCSMETEFRSDSILATKSDAKFDVLSVFPEVELPRIITKQSNLSEKEEDATKTEQVKKATTTSPVKRSNGSATMQVPARKSNVNCPSTGVRLRVNSPRLAASRKIHNHARKSTLSRNRRSLSDSFAVVKSSSDPQRDFKESMVEMIVENNIRGSKDLEDLLACYLSLNSDQYHHLIIKVFKQIWFDLSVVRC